MSTDNLSRHEMEQAGLVYFGPENPLPLPLDELEALHGDEQQLHFLHGAKEVLLEAVEAGVIEEPEGSYPLSLLLDEVGEALTKSGDVAQEELREKLECVLFLSDTPAVVQLHHRSGIDVTFVQSEHRDFGYPEFSCVEWSPLTATILNAL